LHDDWLAELRRASDVMIACGGQRRGNRNPLSWTSERSERDPGPINTAVVVTKDDDQSAPERDSAVWVLAFARTTPLLGRGLSLEDWS